MPGRCQTSRTGDVGSLARVMSEKDRSGVLGTSSGDLLGRDEEVATLHQCLEAARSGRPSVILLGGDAGIGKTRLLSEFVGGCTERVLWGGCLPLGERGVPYLPLIEMMRSLDEDTRSSLSPALAVFAPGDRRESTGGARTRAHLFQGVIEFLEQLAAAAPLIVVVEDGHWADRSTRDLLDFVLSQLRNQRIMLVVSFRTDDLPTDHPLRPTLVEWMRRAAVTRVDLEPLTAEEGLQLVARLLVGSEITRDQAIRLVERADGNPFFLEELAAAGPDAGGPPGRMRDLLLRRTHGLTPDLLRLLRIASAGGTGIDEALLSRVAAVDIEETRLLLRSAIQEQLLVVDDRGCRFRHALLAEALHEDLLPAERREYHAAYADALADQSPMRPEELATHSAEAGRVNEALTYWIAAGEAAEAQFAFAEALAGYQSALDLWYAAEDPETDTGLRRGDLMRRLAETAFLAGEGQLACDIARQVLDEVDEASDPITAGLVYHRLARYVRNTDDLNEALALQERSVALIPSSPPSPERAEVLSGLALIHQFENRYHEAHDLSSEAIEVAGATGAVEAEIRARNTLGETICVLEDLDRGLATIGEALVLARNTGNAHEQARSLWNMQANRYFGGRMSDFVDNAEATMAALRITQPHWIADHMVDTADALQMLGRWDEAEAMVAAAKLAYPTMAERLGVPELLIGKGRLEEAQALVEAQATLLVGYLGPDVTGRVLNLVNQADIALAQRDPTRAMELIDEVLQRYPNLDKPVYVSQGIAVGLRAAADVARAAGIRGEDLELTEAIQKGDRLYARLAEQLALSGPENGWRRLVGCLAAQCDAERSRLHGRPDPDAWHHARERWLGLSMPIRAAYCQFRWAEESLSSGVDRITVESAVRDLSDYLSGVGARLLHDEVRALARRARIDVGDRPGPDRYGLTAREREVLSRLTRGATNRQIADALFISEKTASVHVSNILRKLTAANRGEAAATAIKEGLVDVADLGRGT